MNQKTKSTLVHLGWLILGVAGMVLLIGCSSPDGAMLAAADSFANRTVGPEYLRYVEADPGLSDDEKALRRAHVMEFRRAVSAAGVVHGGGVVEDVRFDH